MSATTKASPTIDIHEAASGPSQVAEDESTKSSDESADSSNKVSRADIPPQDGGCLLLELPPELRLMIYEALFTSFSVSISEQELKYTAALLYTSKEIQGESKPALARQAYSIHTHLYGVWLRATDKIPEGQEDFLSLCKWARDFPLEDQAISRAFKSCRRGERTFDRIFGYRKWMG